MKIFIVHDNYTKSIVSILLLFILFFVCKLILLGTGSSDSERSIFLFISLILILNSSKTAFYYILFPYIILCSVYLPVGMTFGSPSYAYIASIFSTDFNEIKEFFYQIPKVNFLYPLFIIIGIFLFRYFSIKLHIKYHKNKTLLCLLIIFSMINQSPYLFLNKIVNSSMQVFYELIKLNKMMIKSSWGESSLKNSKYDNYILVIGESARRDYHHAYGYPINNTPFMSNSNGTLIDGLTSGGTNTVTSLRLMLTHPNKKKWEPDYSLNFIDLAKSAKIKTYWISNQGFIGKHDTPVTSIARRSDFTFFSKKGDYSSNNTSDFILLNKVKEVINKNEKDKRLIVIHLYGSHPDSCERINDYKKIIKVKDNKYSNIACYISSINKTDDFLKSLYNIMNNNFKDKKSSYSILYFSDHGLSHNEINDIIYINNHSESKLHYNIPLFKISSDDKNKNYCKSFKSGLNFTNGIANWIGIKNKKLSDNYDLFDCNNDEDYGLSQKIEKIKNNIDFAIDIKNK